MQPFVGRVHTPVIGTTTPSQKGNLCTSPKGIHPHRSYGINYLWHYAPHLPPYIFEHPLRKIENLTVAQNTIVINPKNLNEILNERMKKKGFNIEGLYIGPLLV